MLAAVLAGLFLVIAVPAAAGPIDPQAAVPAPNPPTDLAHSLIYAGAGVLAFSIVGAALVAYRRRQY